MSNGRTSTGTRRRLGIGTGAALAGAVVVGLLVVPTGASAAPQLPPVSPEDLVASVAAAKPPALAGTVEVDNDLGLPALPGLPQAANGTSTVRVWSGGDGKARVALPDGEGEHTLVSDGATRWSYDSTDRTATRRPADGGPGALARPGSDAPLGGGDPTSAASDAVARLRTTSSVTVDGTEEVAGRPAYTLVLTPTPTERTLLRQVRVAVDSETRLPLRLIVLANGSEKPALQVGFTDVTVGPQDPSLFVFTPPPGTTVTDAPARPARPEGTRGPHDATTVGDGWDTVVVGRLPAAAPGAAPGAPAAAPAAPGAPTGGPGTLAALGTPISGPWGSGRVITTAVATAIVTDDGRVAVGAVPAQVLTEALAR